MNEILIYECYKTTSDIKVFNDSDFKIPNKVKKGAIIHIVDTADDICSFRVKGINGLMFYGYIHVMKDMIRTLKRNERWY